VIGNTSEEATAAGFVSGLLAYMGEFDKALSYWDRSIKLARDLKNPFTEAASLHYRGIIHDQQGQWGSAIAEYGSARKIAEAAGDAFRVYLVTFMEGHAYQRVGDHARACALIEASIEQATKLGTTFLLGQAKSMLAACCLADVDAPHERVRSLCSEAIGLAEKAGDKFTEALALRTLAESLSASGNPEDRAKARRAIDDAIRMQEEIGVKPELGRSYVTLACLLKVEGHAEEGASALTRATQLFGELGMSWDVEAARRAFERAGNSTGATDRRMA
jgi:tetratricopeptide (TPR) repeat protein